MKRVLLLTLLIIASFAALLPAEVWGAGHTSPPGPLSNQVREGEMRSLSQTGAGALSWAAAPSSSLRFSSASSASSAVNLFGFSPAAATPTPTPTSALPGRSTATPRPGTPLAPPTARVTPFATSPFAFPTRPSVSPTPSRDCTTVFPLDSVARTAFGETTVAQLEAAFGRADSVGGRPTTFRFEANGCTLSVAMSGAVAQTAELADYGTLDLLLERYGLPEGVGIAQGNLTLLLFDVAVLLYPDEGVVAIFDVPPDELTRGTPVATLQFRPPYTLERQIRRLNLRPVADWQPPLR